MERNRVRIPSWVTERLACPRCSGALQVTTLLLRCAHCGPYPRLGGVPILVPEPASWCATFFDAALAALAETQRASAGDVETLRAFADAAGAADPARFSDDWTTWESLGQPAPSLVDGPARQSLDDLASISERAGPTTWLCARTPQGTVLEVGCGAGQTQRRLLSNKRRLVAGDFSLRAVLTAHRHGGGIPVVLDAHALPFSARRFDAIVAENLVDLLDEPARFFSSAAGTLTHTGQLLISTPAPALGAPDGDESTLERHAMKAGFEVFERAIGLPWLRVNSVRFVETWLVNTVRCQLRTEPKRRRPNTRNRVSS
jgi:SAM-dependent methyltransferase